MLYEELLTHISKSGPCYRWTITLMITFLGLKAAFDMFLVNLATASVPFHCAEAIVDNRTMLWSGIADNDSLATNFSINEFTCKRPRFSRGPDGLLHLVTPGTNDSQTRVEDACKSWTFYPDPPERWTMLMEYEMVCDNKYLTDRVQTVFQMGICLSTIFGPLADILGRKPVLVGLCYLDIACNIAIIFAKDLTLQLVLRFLMGFGAPAMIIGIILVMELVAEDYRAIHGSLLWLPFCLGYSGSAAISYFILNWRVQIAVGVLIVVAGYASYIPLLPESPRWLLTRRKTKRAKKMLQEMCKYSNCKEVLENFNVEHNELVEPPEESTEQRVAERNCIFNVIPRENICRTEYFITLGVVTFNFFTVSLVYYALSFQRDFITKDPYLNVMISGLLELPAYVVVLLLTHHCGRKYTSLGNMLFCGVGLVVMPFIPTDPNIVFQGSSVLAIAIKFSVTVNFSILDIFSSEVLPTTVRSCSFFVASLMMRAAQFMAPELGGVLASAYENLPSLLYGGICILAGLSILLPPETKDKPMPNTVAEMEQVGCPCCLTPARPAGQQKPMAPQDDSFEEMKPLRA